MEVTDTSSLWYGRTKEDGWTDGLEHDRDEQPKQEPVDLLRVLFVSWSSSSHFATSRPPSNVNIQH